MKPSGVIGAWSRVSIKVGTQYDDRLAMPPRQVELPVWRSDSGVELAFAPVLPKKVWRCERPGWPGKTIGSSNDMWEKPQTVRNAPAPPPPAGAISSVGATFIVPMPVPAAGILRTSTETTSGLTLGPATGPSAGRGGTPLAALRPSPKAAGIAALPAAATISPEAATTSSAAASPSAWGNDSASPAPPPWPPPQAAERQVTRTARPEAMPRIVATFFVIGDGRESKGRWGRAARGRDVLGISGARWRT